MRNNWPIYAQLHDIPDNNGVIHDLQEFTKYLSHSNIRGYVDLENDARGAKMKVTSTLFLKTHVEKFQIFASPRS